MTTAAPDIRPLSWPPAVRHARPPSSARRQMLTATSAALALGIAAMLVLSLFLVSHGEW
jgi:hypothetical protein